MSLEKHLFNEHEASQFLSCSPALLRKMRLLHQGPAFCRIGRLVRYPLEGLEAYVAARRVEFGGAR
jgi:hypothetical protein